ncbi:hypothetical protein HanXRQr2_Chr05g0222691 [Helianthus annuus]|uniref:Uncharacterized protein n=1 Tax=Helianthus annuus TaxID=4232 RepID=A0A251UN37_HELAN|nr:hypothetical protein HanXRQr2_Chr05g0222691 [Helianthus annuus]KAJ0923363.1 hypothetical protein HanPSC8_Chr05g0215031 [Helianthus annuus]
MKSVGNFTWKANLQVVDLEDLYKGNVSYKKRGRDELGANRYRTLQYQYMKVKNGCASVLGTPKSVPNWYLRSFGSANFVPVPRTICSSLTTCFIRTTTLPHNFFG